MTPKKMAKPELIYKDEAYAIMGACFAVYRDKGCGFLEAVYQECLEIEFEYCDIPAKAKQPLLLTYRGRTLRQVYQPDFICHEKIIVEIKAVSELADEHRAQLLNYLSTTGFQLGVLVNFGHYPEVEYERLVNTGKTFRKRRAPRIEDITL
jgi:GxxExxY protein